MSFHASLPSQVPSRIHSSNLTIISPLPAPDFSLADQFDRSFHLSTDAANRPAIIVFYRGHWCPYCRRYLAKLQSNHARFMEQGVILVAISPEPVATSRALAIRLGINFPLLADLRGQVIEQYGVRNSIPSSRIVRPHPAVFILDTSHAIRFSGIDRDYKKRTTMHSIFRVLKTFRDTPMPGQTLPASIR